MNPFKLNSGHTIPAVGLGLWEATNKAECMAAVNTALDTGYRHFDTAQAYGNEAYLGEALASSSVPRDELFITTKIKVENILVGNITKSFEKSCAHLQLDYVDLLLLHFPVSLRRGPAWHKLEEIATSGRAKSIGVSNYTIKHLEELLSECSIKPAVNQVELHVFLQQPDLVKFCHENDILVEAYSPLAHGHGLDNPVLAELAKKHGKTPAQIMIRWCLEIDTVPLPKSVTPDRIRSNFDVTNWSLDAADMKQLTALNSNLRTCWDPTHVA